MGGQNFVGRDSVIVWVWLAGLATVPVLTQFRGIGVIRNTPAPPSSDIGVSITRSGPKRSTRSPVTWNAPP